jgi:hypothetical protein
MEYQFMPSMAYDVRAEGRLDLSKLDPNLHHSSLVPAGPTQLAYQ